jgi:stage II sporulation protein D
MLRLSILLFGIMLLTPVLAFLIRGQIEIEPEPETTITESIIYENIYTVPSEIRLKSDGKITKVSMKDYVTGAMFAFLPADIVEIAPPEALKALALAIYTYAVRETVKNADNTYDVTDDSSTYIKYYDEALARHLYSDGYDRAFERISAAVEGVLGYVIIFEDEPIAAVYNLVSGEKTESALNIYGAVIPYLQAVESFCGKSELMKSEFIFTPAEIRARLLTEAGAEFSENAELKITEKTDSGTVKKIKVGDKTLSGTEFAEILNLPSPNFDITFDGINFNIYTYGIGNGVGMPFAGALALAEDGADFREIIKHFYTGIEIVEVNIN